MKRIFALILCIVLILLPLSACSDEPIKVTKTEYYSDSFSFASYSSFSEAKNNSDIVIYGEITEIGKAYFSVPDGGMAHTPVKIKPIKLLKGEIKDDTITYNALGGIIRDTEYISKAYPTSDFEIGSKVLLFLCLDKSGDFYCDISPLFTFLENEEGKINVGKQLIPKEWRVSDDLIPYLRVSYPVDTDNVIEFIEIGFTAWKEKYRSE